MLYRSLCVLALAVVAVVGGGCSGGGSTGTKFNSASCGQSSGGKAFCLTGCSLGCSVGGCSVTDIASNQPIRMTFSQEVDINSVNFSTISFKTPSGRAPQGRFDVRDNIVEFIPDIKVTGSVTTFGFSANETYLLTLPDGGQTGQSVRSTSGDLLAESLSCTFRVSRGIVDLDKAPPKAKLISPATLSDVKKDAVIVLEFSEIIDRAPFQGATTQTTPINYLIRKTMQKPGGLPSERICDPNFNPLILEGQPQAENIPGANITVITLRPTVPLPSQICIEVVVTNQVTDLAGTPAVPHSFKFTTAILVSGEGEIKETFSGDGQLDTQVSSGIWSGGKALPPVIGGTGELGYFDASQGVSDPLDPNHYTWNTDDMTLAVIDPDTKKPVMVQGPGGLQKKLIRVTDGVFEFSDFHLPKSFTVTFVGSNPVQIRVRGEAKVEGTLQANAGHVGFFNANVTPGTPKASGQKGAPGGPGGGTGGAGGNSCPNTGANASYDGGKGSDVTLLAGHGYAAQAVGTGGKGSPHWPRSGSYSSYCALGNVFGAGTAAGGGGGGFHTAGTVGSVTKSPCNSLAVHMGTAPGTGGLAFDLGSFTPKTAGPDAALNHFSVGGSGGGGGGSHPLLSRGSPYNKWLPGTAGAGGGGIVAFRVGQNLIMSVGSRIEVKGGNGYFIDSVNRAGESGDNLFNVPSPGGGGSGGSILLQVYGKPTMLGVLDTSGGKGGTLDNIGSGQASLASKSFGGNGAPGYFRLETVAGPSVIEIGSGVPQATVKNGGKLTDKEFAGVSQSRFYSTKLTFPPTFLRYEVEAYINGLRKVYSDEVRLGDPKFQHYDKDYAGRATETEPVYFQLQGAKVSTVTGQADLETLGPWREAAFSKLVPSLNDDGSTGLRFSLTYDTAGGTKTIEVRRVSVFYVE